MKQRAIAFTRALRAGFHRYQAVAPLKLRARHLRRVARGEIPPLPSGGPIEAERKKPLDRIDFWIPPLPSGGPIEAVRRRALPELGG